METVKKLKLRFTGIVPLILHNGQLANPTNPIVKQIKEVTSKKKKTDSDYERLAELQFCGSLYLKNKKIVIPSYVLEATIIGGAKKDRRGQDFKAAMFVEDDYPLIYKGEQDPTKLYENKEFVDQSLVVINRQKVVTTRPIFKEWKLEMEIAYYPEILNEKEIITATEKAGMYVGLCDNRPRYGRFTVEVIK